MIERGGIRDSTPRRSFSVSPLACCPSCCPLAPEPAMLCEVILDSPPHGGVERSSVPHFGFERLSVDQQIGPVIRYVPLPSGLASLGASHRPTNPPLADGHLHAQWRNPAIAWPHSAFETRMQARRLDLLPYRST